MLRAGLPFPEHDERYAYGREWLEVLATLMRGEHLTHRGRHFEVADDYYPFPTDRYRDRPTIYMGGQFEPARQLAADAADILFINRLWLEARRAGPVPTTKPSSRTSTRTR